MTLNLLHKEIRLKRSAMATLVSEIKDAGKQLNTVQTCVNPRMFDVRGVGMPPLTRFFLNSSKLIFHQCLTFAVAVAYLLDTSLVRIGYHGSMATRDDVISNRCASHFSIKMHVFHLLF